MTSDDLTLSPAQVGPPRQLINNGEAVEFGPVYYDQAVIRRITVGIQGDTTGLSITVSSGEPYFCVVWSETPVPGAGGAPRAGADSAPFGSGPGRGPVVLPVTATATLMISLSVPSGVSLPLGALRGTIQITAPEFSDTVSLQATLYGKMIGELSVSAATVAPAQPVQIQVLDTLGQPISDPAVSVTVQGVPGVSRWEQYATTGVRTLFAIASNGTLTETATAQVDVSGDALLFTASLPSTMQVPVIEASLVAGLPYAGRFTLGTPRTPLGVPVTATPVSLTAPAAAPTVEPPGVAGPVVAKPVAMLLAPVRGPGGEVLIPGGPHPPGAPMATSYTWDFGDGSAPVTTQSPEVTHDFFPVVSGAAIEHFFDVTCTAVHDNVSVKRTIVLHSAYGMCRQLGTIVPPVTGAPTYAPIASTSGASVSNGLTGFTASMIVHNLESADITLNSLAIVPLSDTATVAPPAPVFTTMTTPQTIAAGAASALGTFVPFSALSLGGPAANAFALYFSGSDAGGTPVRFSNVFRISASYSGITQTKFTRLSPAWDRANALMTLATFTAANGSASPGNVDAVTRTISIPLANAHATGTAIQATSTVQAALSGIASAAAMPAGAPPPLAAIAPPGIVDPKQPAPPVPVPQDLTGTAYDPPPVVAGNACYPDDISDADAASAASQQLVCQLTSAQPQTVLIPAAFQNAQAGDVILSPAPTGDGDLIATMFAALTPPQRHGHSGLMTENFYEITHCTSSVARVSDNVNTDAVGIPTSLNGEVLQYGWPGSLTQTIDEAINSVPWTAPEGKTYNEASFNVDDRGNPQQLVPPIVVKPFPETEATARPKLRQAADLARSKGARYASPYNLPADKTLGDSLSPAGCYYSFYSYTKAQQSVGFTNPAPADAGWAAGLSPAVCSAFVWLCMKEVGIPCVSANANETLADFTAQALATGAVAVSPDPTDPTLDGLIYYSEQERQDGAYALYNLFMEKVQSKESGLGSLPGVNSTIAGPIADQLMNCFAFGDPNMVNESNWQNPGTGNAVSPDNIMLWSPPYFGYAEPLQYLPQHTDQATPSEWVRVTTHGTITGKVTRADTGAPVPGALVWANLNVPGMYASTGNDGTYALTDVPLGLYALKASATLKFDAVDVEFTNGLGVDYTLTAANDGNGTQDLVIKEIGASFRQINVTYQTSCDHGDNNPGSTTGTQTAGPYSRSLFLNPGQQTSSFAYTFDYNGGGYFHVAYTFSAALLADGTTVQIGLLCQIIDDSSGNVQESGELSPDLQLAAGASETGYYNNLEAAGAGYHNGPANFSFTLANVQQTG